MSFEEFVTTLFLKSTNVSAMLRGTIQEAKALVASNLEKDGLICHYFSGDIASYMTANETHTFLVVPGKWASEIIEKFPDEFLKGSLATLEEEEEVGFRDKYLRGEYGVVFERSVPSAYKELGLMSLNCPFRLVRFANMSAENMSVENEASA